MLSQMAETIKDVGVCSHFVPLEKTVLQAMNQYTVKTFVYHVHLMKVVIKILTEFKSQVISFTDLKTVVSRTYFQGVKL